MIKFISEVISQTASVVEDAIDVSAALMTLGEVGNLNKQNVSRLIAAGLTVAAISEATGIAVELIESVISEE